MKSKKVAALVLLLTTSIPFFGQTKKLEAKEIPPIVKIDAQDYQVESEVNLKLSAKDFGKNPFIKNSFLYENGVLLKKWNGEPKDTTITRTEGKYFYELIAEDFWENKEKDELKIKFIGKQLTEIYFSSEDSIRKEAKFIFYSKKPSLDSKIKEIELYENNKKIKSWKEVPENLSISKNENKIYEYFLKIKTNDGDSTQTKPLRVKYHGFIDEFPESKINFKKYYKPRQGNSPLETDYGGLFLESKDFGDNPGIIYSALYKDTKKIIEWNGSPAKEPVTIFKSNEFHEYLLMVIDRSGQKDFSKVKINYDFDKEFYRSIKFKE